MILSAEYENKVLDLLRGQGIPAIQTFYLGLIKVADGSEVVGDSYTRITLPSSLLMWKSTQGTMDEVSTGDTGEISNAVPITWGTALETWGTVNKIRFFTTPSGDNYFCDIPIDQIIINTGTNVQIYVGDFVISTREE